MDKSTLGKIITQYQKEHGLTQKVVHDGIGSQASFQRSDYGRRDVDFIIQETMLARVGQAAESFEVVLGDEEYEEWSLRMAIRSAEAARDYKLVEEKVCLYRQQNADKHKLHEQFCLYYEMKLAQWKGRDAEVVGALAEQALSLTKDTNKKPQYWKNLYTPMEMDLLLTLVQCRYGDWKDVFKAGDCLQKIVDYVRTYFATEKREDIEGRARVEQIKLNEECGQKENLFFYIEDAIRCFSGATGIERLAEVRFIKAKLLWREYGETPYWREQEKLCKRECMMAYCIYDSLKQTDKLKEIEDFCREELQWHITMQI